MTAPTLPDLDTALLEDFAVPCETKTLDVATGAVGRCDRPAEWIVRTTCHCGHVEIDLLCDPHHRAGHGDTQRFMCSACLCIGRFTDRQAERL